MIPTQTSLDEALDIKAQRPLSAEERKTAREQLEEALADYARKHLTAKDITRRLFAQETGKAVSLLDLLRQDLDVVVINPPYGDPTERAKSILKKQNEDNYTDNYGAFVERGLSLALPHCGYIGALTWRASYACRDSRT